MKTPPYLKVPTVLTGRSYKNAHSKKLKKLLHRQVPYLVVASCFLLLQTMPLKVHAQGTPGTFFAHSFWRDGIAENNPNNPIVYPSNIISPFNVGGIGTETFPPGGYGYYLETPASRLWLAQKAKNYLNPLPNGKRHMYGQGAEDLYRDYGVWSSNGSQTALDSVRAIWGDFFRLYDSIGGLVDYVSFDLEGFYYGPLLQHMKYAVFDPIRQYFPSVQLTQYDNYWVNYNQFPVKNVYGNTAFSDTIIGSHQNPVLYGWCQNSLNAQFDGLPTRFKIFMHDVDVMRAARLSKPTVHIRPYIAWSTYNWTRTEGNAGLSDTAPLATGPDVATQTPYYREMLYHVALEGADNFTFFNICPPYGNTVPFNQLTSQADVDLLSNIFKELDEIVGYPVRTPLQNLVISQGLFPDYSDLDPNPVYNRQKYVLSGMNAGGRNVWRISCDLDTVSEAAFKISNSPLTFAAAGDTIVFPEGSVIYTPVHNNGQAGYWVTSATGTVPSVNGIPIRASLTSTNVTLFTTQTPAGSYKDPLHELGMKFLTSVAGQITKIKFYKISGETGTHTGRIWSPAGIQLSSAVFTNETDSGWQIVTLPTPLNINANLTYTVSVNAVVNYASSVGALEYPISNGTLSSFNAVGGVYNNAPGTRPTISSNTNYFRDIVFTPALGTLPVHFTDVSASLSGANTVLIKWQIVFPAANASIFDIEYSTDGSNWNKAGRMPITNPNKVLYDFTHTDIPAAIMYYHIKQTDQDGKFTYSKAVLVNNKKSVSLYTVYPNPANRYLYIVAPASVNGTTDVQLYDAAGKLVAATTMTMNRISIPVYYLPDGNYVLKLGNDKTVITQIVVLQKKGG